MNELERGLGPDNSSSREIEEAYQNHRDDSAAILAALDLVRWTDGAPRRHWPPTRVQVNATNQIGYIMSRGAGYVQVATGVRENGGPEYGQYRPSEYTVLRSADAY